MYLGEFPIHLEISLAQSVRRLCLRHLVVFKKKVYTMSTVQCCIYNTRYLDNLPTSVQRSIEGSCISLCLIQSYKQCIYHLLKTFLCTYTNCIRNLSPLYSCEYRAVHVLAQYSSYFLISYTLCGLHLSSLASFHTNLNLYRYTVILMYIEQTNIKIQTQVPTGALC